MTGTSRTWNASPSATRRGGRWPSAPGADDGRENHQRAAADAIAHTARVFLAAATKAQDENGVRCWTQILTYASRVTP